MRLLGTWSLLAIGLAGCTSTSNFGTAKMARANEVQIYPHATFYGKMGDSGATSATGIFRSFGGSLVYGFSHHVNLRAKYERATLKNEDSYQKLGLGSPTARLDDDVYSVELKLSHDGISKAASIGFQGFQKTGIYTMIAAMYLNGYFRDNLYLCLSPYVYVVTYQDSQGGFTTLAGNISVTYEYLETFFIRPEFGTSLVFPEFFSSTTNVGLAAGLMF